MDIKESDMKKHIILMMLITFATGAFAASFSSQKAERKRDLKNNHQQAVILDGGVKRTIHIAKDSQLKSKMNSYDAKRITSKDGVIVNFIDSSYLSVDEFAKKYGLKFKQRLMIGYYIFDNVSQLSDLQIVEKIITNETNVETVKPNWKMKKILY